MAFFARSEPRGAPPTGWALAFDAAVAVGAAIGAVYEMAERSVGATVMVAVPGYDPFGGPVPLPVRRVGGLVVAGQVHPGLLLMAAAALTALPLAARRFYPIGVWLAIAAAIVAVHAAYVPPVALGTAVYAAYSAITYSRYRNLAIAVVSVVTVAVAGTLGNELPGSRTADRDLRDPAGRAPPASASACCAAGWPTRPPGCGAPATRRRPRPSGH